MRQRVHRDIQRQLLAVFGTDAFAFVAGVVGTEGAAETVLAHDRHQVALIKKAFELDVAGFVEAADAVYFVEGTVNEVVVRDWFHLFTGEDSTELAAPGFGKFGVRAAAGTEKEATVTEIFAQVFDLSVGEGE